MSTIHGISQIAIPVHDLTAAKEFYCSVLGCEHLFSVEQMVFLAIGDMRLMLSLPDPPEMKNNSNILYFETTDIVSISEQMKRAGTVFLKDPECIGTLPDQELWMAFFRDPSGNILALEERKTK